MRDRERAALERLTRLGGAQLATELVTLYLDDTPTRIAAAVEALGATDAAALAKAVHSIKSSSAQLGADELASACQAVEDAAERGDLSLARARLRDVENSYLAFSTRVSQRMGDPDALPGAISGGCAAEGAPRPRIAVVEDNADNRLLIDAILGDAYVLDEYATGTHALEAMPTRRPDLVLLDVSLPGMDGLVVLSRMRADTALRDVPVVAVTAHAMAGDRDRYLASGFDGYVAKPIEDDRVLIDTVERLLSGRPSPVDDAPAASTGNRRR